MEDTEELALFRRQWQEELRCSPLNQELRRKEKNSDEEEKQEEATTLYWMGVAAERGGDMQSAILYYRQAVQLIPDIEFKVHSQEGSDLKEDGEEREEGDTDTCLGSRACQETVPSLTDSFHYLMLSGAACHPERPPRGTHISALPQDVLRLILRWVISSHLNMRDLEQCSMVSRGFYCLARAPGLWRMVCHRLWDSCALSSIYSNSWRQMYIHRPHLHFNGVYISKISYVRAGERSLDGYYKPYHTVTYYRYLRFFPDGVVMHLTSPDEPAGTVAKLCHKHSSEAVLLGEYCLDGHKLSIDVLSCHPKTVPAGRQKGRERKGIVHEQHFHMELSMKRGRRQQLFNQLVWQEHYCHSLQRSTGHVQLNHFTIDYKYPPFLFSRVKSYTTNSHGIL